MIRITDVSLYYNNRIVPKEERPAFLEELSARYGFELGNYVSNIASSEGQEYSSADMFKPPEVDGYNSSFERGRATAAIAIRKKRDGLIGSVLEFFETPMILLQAHYKYVNDER